MKIIVICLRPRFGADHAPRDQHIPLISLYVRILVPSSLRGQHLLLTKSAEHMRTAAAGRTARAAAVAAAARPRHDRRAVRGRQRNRSAHLNR